MDFLTLALILASITAWIILIADIVRGHAKAARYDAAFEHDVQFVLRHLRNPDDPDTGDPHAMTGFTNRREFPAILAEAQRRLGEEEAAARASAGSPSHAARPFRTQQVNSEDAAARIL